MAQIDVNFVFDDQEISYLNAFKVYYAHLQQDTRESFHKITGNIYVASTCGSGDFDDPVFIEVELWNPKINVIDP